MCYSNTHLVSFNAQAFPRAWEDLYEKTRLKVVSWHGLEKAPQRWGLLSILGGAHG